MILDRVTITGADDTVRPYDLWCLSKEFPFVEWGILFSHRQQGGPRFPSLDWVHDLASLAEGVNIGLSAHLCGGWVRELLAGEFTFAHLFPALVEQLDRVQLNFHGERAKVNVDRFLNALSDRCHQTTPFHLQCIFQLDGVNDELCNRAQSRGIDAVGLHDLSGGAGILPRAWPGANFHFYTGYAGGLGPDNLEVQIQEIEKAAGNAKIWIDMETKVRSEDDGRFLLEKVHRCLEVARPYVERQGSIDART